MEEKKKEKEKHESLIHLWIEWHLNVVLQRATSACGSHAMIFPASPTNNSVVGTEREHICSLCAGVPV